MFHLQCTFCCFVWFLVVNVPFAIYIFLVIFLVMAVPFAMDFIKIKKCFKVFIPLYIPQAAGGKTGVFSGL